MTKGVTLLAIGGDAYREWAVQIACSIKHFAPDLLIQLVTTPDIKANIKRFEQERVFDYFTDIERHHYLNGDQLAPGKAKLALPQYFLFDKTLYLDVDGGIIRDLTPLFDTEGDLVMHIHNWYELGLEEKPATMYWCNSSVIMEHYKLSGTTKLPALNTSAYIYVKTEANKALFTQAYKNLTENPIPKDKYYKTWGRGKGLDPDELYLNIAFGQIETPVTEKQIIYFRPVAETSSPSLTDIRAQYYGIGLYGGEDFNHQEVKRYYDAILRPMFEKAFPGKPFRKAHQLTPHKIVNQKFLT